MFNRESWTITESVVESVDSAVESANSTTNSAADPVKIGLWVRAFKPRYSLVRFIPADLFFAGSAVGIDD